MQILKSPKRNCLKYLEKLMKLNNRGGCSLLPSGWLSSAQRRGFQREAGLHSKSPALALGTETWCVQKEKAVPRAVQHACACGALYCSVL